MPIPDWTKTAPANSVINPPNATKPRISAWANPTTGITKTGIDVSAHPFNPLNKTNQFTNPNAEQPKVNIFKEAFKPDNLKDAIKSAIPGTVETVSQIKNDPLNIKNIESHDTTDILKKSLTSSWHVIKESVAQEGDRIKELFDASKPGQTSNSKFLGSGLKVLSGGANVVFSPITALFEGAKEVPILGTVSRLVTVPFQAIGEGQSGWSTTIIDKLPISSEAKSQLKPGIQEILSLAAQLALGKAGLDAKAWDALKTRFGEADATTIVQKAQELAHQETGARTLGKLDLNETQEMLSLDSKMSELGRSQFKQQSPSEYKRLQELTLKTGDPTQYVDKTVLDGHPNAGTMSPQETAKLENLNTPRLAAPKDEYVSGEGFEMREKADLGTIKEAQAKNKTLSAYKEAVASFNKNPTSFKLKKIQNLRAEIKSLSPEVSKPTFSENVREEVAPKANVVEPSIKESTSAVNEDGTKTTKLAKDINTEIVKKGFDALTPEQQAKFDPITKETTLAKVANFMKEPDIAKEAVKTGEMPGDFKGADKQVFFNAMEEQALKNNDMQGLIDLANSPIATELSVAAQTLGASGFNKAEGAVKAIQEVLKAREEKATKKVGNLGKAKRELAKEVKDQIRKIQTKETWGSFVESLKC